MTTREDLLHLSPEALSHAANAGIVKRAVRELAGGYRPQLELDAQGTLQAQFADGVQCRWPTGVSIQNVQCSCGAAGVCRHRVIAALAYREHAAAEMQAPPALVPVSEASDEALARVVPVLLRQLAERLRDEGLAIELRSRASGEPCDTARLPSATVRFWSGAALEAARCDCVRAAACEHVVLGLWAFREAASRGADVRVVRLGAPGAAHTVDRTPYEQLAEAIIRHGVSQGTVAWAQSLSSARVASSSAAWLALLMGDLETWGEAYARRSALYDAAEGVDLLAELSLRIAAGGQPAHGITVLGIGQAGETPLDRLRMMCLGARTRRDGEARRTTLVLADIDTGTRLALMHDWQVPAASQADEASLRAAERLAPGVRLEALAQGHLLAQQATRLADGSVRLARARNAQNSVLPQSADWAQLGSPVRFDSVAALLAEQRAHPNAALQPRHAARRYIVFSPAGADPAAYDANAQCIVAVLRDADGQPLLLRRAHERHVPHALDAIAASLSGRLGAFRHVAGVLSWEHGLPCIEPWALGCDGVMVPDFAAAHGALPTVPLGLAHQENEDPCVRGLEGLRQQVAVLLHHGLARLPRTWAGDSVHLAHRLESLGLRELAGRLRLLVPDVLAAQANPASAALAPCLMVLMALRQLHADAAALDDPAH